MEKEKIISDKKEYNCSLYSENERNHCDRFRFRNHQACEFCVYKISIKK